jgi:hypothetical protein
VTVLLPLGLLGMDDRGLATRQQIQRESQRCRLVHTNPVPFERRDPSIGSSFETVCEKPRISRSLGIDDPIVCDARLRVLVQLHHVISSVRARRYNLHDEHDIRRRDPSGTRPHRFDIPICWALRSLFDALDGINSLTDQLANVSGSIAA